MPKNPVIGFLKFRHGNHINRCNQRRIGWFEFLNTRIRGFLHSHTSRKGKGTKIVDIFKPAYECENLKIGQNIKYDILVLRNYGVRVGGKLWDTMVAHYILQPELPHNMDSLAEKYLDYSTIKIEELIGPKGKNQKNMRELLPQNIYEYACEDADVTLRLQNVLKPELAKAEMENLFNDVEMPLVNVLVEMEENG